MRVLFLSNQMPGNFSAYDTRLDGLRDALSSLGVHTGNLWLREMYFNRPHLAFVLNGRTIARYARGYDIIHAGGSGATLAAIAARRWNSHRVVFDVHGDELHEALLNFHMRRSVRNTYIVLQAAVMAPLAQRYADKLLMVSEAFIDRYHQQKGVALDRMHLVINGVDTGRFSPASDCQPEQVTICYAGSFQSWQAIDVLVDAFAEFVEDNVRYQMIGFGPRDQSLKRAIAARLGPAASLEDWMSKDDLIQRLQTADILVISRTQHPAMRGGLPSKFAEYLAMGKMLIVTDVDEAARFVEQHRCGLVCAPTTSGMVDAIRKALAMARSEQKAMGHNARRLAITMFDWRVIAENYLAALEEMLAHTNKQ